MKLKYSKIIRPNLKAIEKILSKNKAIPLKFNINMLCGKTFDLQHFLNNNLQPDETGKLSACVKYKIEVPNDDCLWFNHIDSSIKKELIYNKDLLHFMTQTCKLAIEYSKRDVSWIDLSLYQIKDTIHPSIPYSIYLHDKDSDYSLCYTFGESNLFTETTIYDKGNIIHNTMLNSEEAIFIDKKWSQRKRLLHNFIGYNNSLILNITLIDK
jgi:hypothetical protein